MIYANPVTKDGEPIGIKTVSSQVYNEDGTTIEDTLRNFKEAFNKGNVRVTDVTISANSWKRGTSGYYEATITNANISTSSCVEVHLHIEYIDVAVEAEILSINKSEVGAVRLYAKNSPSGNIIVDLFIGNEVK